MTVKLALYKGRGGIANAVIRWWTSSIYSHCELVVDGLCYSSSVMDKGVRRKQIDLAAGKWDLIDLPWADRDTIVEYFQATDHHVYGWLGLITAQLFNRNQGVSGTQFCSQWCAAAIGLPNTASYSPGSLGRACAWTNAAVAA
jgi:hypothetical protein